METDPSNLPRRIAHAEEAISLRMTELRSSSNGELESQAIESAKSGLLILKNEINSYNRINSIFRLPICNS
jgi:hypothetical protein